MAWLATLLRNILRLSQDVPEEFLRKYWELLTGNSQELVLKNFFLWIFKNCPKFGRHYKSDSNHPNMGISICAVNAILHNWQEYCYSTVFTGFLYLIHFRLGDGY